jgi:catechol 2,3-dioxygenase-like lactoylglutathione lyase family enzyme
MHVLVYGQVEEWRRNAAKQDWRSAVQTRLGHLQINVQRSNLPFYKELLTFLGWQIVAEWEETLGMGDANGTSLWFAGQVKDVANDYDGVGMNHLAIATPSQADVDTAASYLTERGVELLFETPRHRPEFGDDNDTYYQVMFESPDRVLFEVVYYGPKDG